MQQTIEKELFEKQEVIEAKALSLIEVKPSVSPTAAPTNAVSSTTAKPTKAPKPQPSDSSNGVAAAFLADYCNKTAIEGTPHSIS
jgi:hypothetical protein